MCSYCYTPSWMLKRYLFCSLYLIFYFFIRILIYNFMFRFLISGNDKQDFTSLPPFVFCMCGCISSRGCIHLVHYFIQNFSQFYSCFIYLLFGYFVTKDCQALSQTSFLVQYCQDDTVSHKHVFTAMRQMLTSCSLLAQTQFNIA